MRIFLILVFLCQALCPAGYAGGFVSLLPAPGAMTGPSEAFIPASLKGVRLKDDTSGLHLEFVLTQGQEKSEDSLSQANIKRLVSYFLSALTLPSEDMWVNLSPYEGDRIIPDKFGLTEMGRDLLAQDYLLKQLSATLLFPEKDLGRKFWDEVYRKASARYGVSDIPVDTFNKVWIMPDKATVYENGMTGFVVKSRLKVMLEADYLAASQTALPTQGAAPGDTTSTKEILREIIIPAIEKEVNEGRQFANLRQIYDAMVLAVWFKTALKSSILGRSYADKGKVVGIDVNTPAVNQDIYERYIQAFRKGVFDYVKEEKDPLTQELLPRKYFSGGAVAVTSKDLAMVHELPSGGIFDAAAIVDVKLDRVDASQETRFKKDYRRMVAVVSAITMLTHGKHTAKAMHVKSLLTLVINSIELILILSDRQENEKNFLRKVQMRARDLSKRYDEFLRMALEVEQEDWKEAESIKRVGLLKEGYQHFLEDLTIFWEQFSISGLQKNELVSILKEDKELQDLKGAIDELLNESRVMKDIYIPALMLNMAGEEKSKEAAEPVDLLNKLSLALPDAQTKAGWLEYPGALVSNVDLDEKFLVNVPWVLLWMIIERFEENARVYLRELDEDAVARAEIGPALERKDLRTTYALKHVHTDQGPRVRLTITNPGDINTDLLAINPNLGIPWISVWNVNRSNPSEGGTSWPFAGLGMWNMGLTWSIHTFTDEGTKKVSIIIDLPEADMSQKSDVLDLNNKSKDLGGIDLDEKHLDLDIQHRGDAASAPEFSTALDNMAGLVPVIVQVSPLNDLAGYLKAK